MFYGSLGEQPWNMIYTVRFLTSAGVRQRSALTRRHKTSRIRNLAHSVMKARVLSGVLERLQNLTLVICLLRFGGLAARCIEISTNRILPRTKRT